MQEQAKHQTIICEGCGYDYARNEMAPLPKLVNLRDGSQRELWLCGNICADFWDNTVPGEWVELRTPFSDKEPEEIQLVLWRCVICDSVYDCDLLKSLYDTDEIDLETLTANGHPPTTVIVCSFCTGREPDRFMTSEQLGLPEES